VEGDFINMAEYLRQNYDFKEWNLANKLGTVWKNLEGAQSAKEC